MLCILGIDAANPYEWELRFFKYGFCVKQKINQKNTWELNLIDHLCEIIKVEDENNAETNFQKVSFRFHSFFAFENNTKKIKFNGKQRLPNHV